MCVRTKCLVGKMVCERNDQSTIQEMFEAQGLEGLNVSNYGRSKRFASITRREPREGRVWLILEVAALLLHRAPAPARRRLVVTWLCYCSWR